MTSPNLLIEDLGNLKINLGNVHVDEKGSYNKCNQGNLPGRTDHKSLTGQVMVGSLSPGV